MHAIRNPTSARISVPSILTPSVSGNPPAYRWRTPLQDTAPYWLSELALSCPSVRYSHGIIMEDCFTSLSSKFLSARTARLLALAGTERLDRELMIGHMQGKFQLEVLAGVGHMIHEV